MVENKESFEIPGYQYFRSDRKKRKKAKRGSGGIVVFFKKEIKSGITKIHSQNIDSIWCKLSKNFFGLDKDLYICSTYIPPVDSFIHKDYDVFNTLNSEISCYSNLGNVLLLGDLNSRISKYQEIYIQEFLNENSDTFSHSYKRNSEDLKNNSQGKKLMQIINSNNLVVMNGRKIGDLNGAFTCIHYNGCSVVDYCISSWELYDKIQSFTVGNFTTLSDHCPISCVIKCNIKLIKNKSICKNKRSLYKYIWNDDTKQNFLMELNSYNTKCKLNTFMNQEFVDVNSASVMFENIVKSVADVSLKKVKCRNFKKNNFEFSNECKELKHNFKKFNLEFKQDSSNCDKRIRMLIARNKYRKEINARKNMAKELKIHNLSGLEKSDPKTFWKSIRSMLNRNHQNDSSITDDEWVNYFSKLLNNNNVRNSEFSEYISSSLSTLENCVDQSQSISFNNPFDSEEIIKSIKELKPAKASGIDAITNDMLKSGCSILHQPINKLFNHILSSGIFPGNWNCSLLTPIHKKGSLDDPTNYRGIAVSNAISKIFLKIVTKRLDSHMTASEHWTKYQNGFKSKMRTEDNLFILKTAIHEMTVKRDKPLYVCFVDFSKFFDTINRDMLLYKLLKYGICGNMYNVIKSMYKNCSYSVKDHNGLSDFFKSTIGMKQGCPLSPLLSNLFQNDLHENFDDSCDPVSFISSKVNSLSWADDLVLMSTSPKGLQNCLNKLGIYCDKWCISVNVSKTNCMVFGKGKLAKLYYKGTKIEQVNSYNYLGVCLHKSGKIKYSIDDRIAKASRAINMIQGALSTNGNVSVNIALSLFQKQVVPILTYGSIYWGVSTCYDKIYLENIPEHVNSLKDINSFLKCNNYITQYKRVGRKGELPRKVLAEVNSYDSKLELLHNINSSYDFTRSQFVNNFEKVQTKFFKFILNINRFASNKAIRAELGQFPLHIYSDTKLVRYWHRLELMENDSILKEAYNLSKLNNHDWYTNIINSLKSNGLMYICCNPENLSSVNVGDIYKKCLECQYIQLWDSQASESSNLKFLYTVKTGNYTQSVYLDAVENIKHRKQITKLRLGCSKLGSHLFKSKNSFHDCKFGCNEIESIEHFLLHCGEYKEIRNNFLKDLDQIGVKFCSKSDQDKIKCILELNCTTHLVDKNSFKNLCIKFIDNLFDHRF